MFTKKEILPIFIILAIIAFSFYIYPSLPDQVPSHWNERGEIDAYSGKTFAVLFFPGLTLGIYLLMMFLPRLDPLRKNYPSFSTAYYWIRTVLVVFFSGLYLFTIWTALGGDLKINNFIIPAISILFIVIGILLPKVKKNYFVGIRTPWTLASEETWNKTHSLGGKLFVLTGLLTLLSPFLSEKPMTFLIFTVIEAVIIVFVYSYLIYKKVEKLKNNN
jgi:uncharacterized membrane protein